MMRPIHMDYRTEAIGDLALGRTLDHELRDMHVLVGRDSDGHAIALLDVVQMGPLLIENVERDIDRGGGDQRHHAIGDKPVLDRAQDVERDRFDRAHHADALTHGARLGRAFEHAGPELLARHFQQAEMTDAPDLNACTVVAQRLLQPPFHQPVVAALVHVDEVDDDQPGKVAQAKLARDASHRYG